MAENILHVRPDVYLYDPFGRRHLPHHPGRLVSVGTVVATDARLLFIPSRGLWQKLWGSPKVRTPEEADRLLTARKGFAIPSAELASARVAGKHPSGYADGAMGCSDLAVISAAAGGSRVFRFITETAAEEILRAIVPGAATGAPPVSPVAAELAGLGIPADYLLPAPPEMQMQVVWLRSTIGFAWRTLQEGKADLAIADAAKVIDDPRLRAAPPFALGLAAAHFIRGAAWEKKGDRDKAAEDYRQALILQPEYVTAQNALERLGGGTSERRSV